MNPTAPLVLRAIKYERLDDGEADLQDADKGPKKPGLFSRAKAAMTDNVSRAKQIIPRDPVAGLSKELIPIRAALRRWHEIEAEHDARCDTSAYDKHLEKARAKFAASHSPEDHERVFLAHAVLKERQVAENDARRSAYSGSRELEWIQIPAVRDSIRKALTLKIEVAKLELERVRVSEQKHLGPKFDASESPPVKDKAGKVAMWEQQLTQLETRMVVHDPVMEAQRFLAAAKLLLEGDESTGKKFIHKDDGDIYVLQSIEAIRDPDLAEYERTHHLQSAIGGKSWLGGKADFEKVFKKL